MLDHSFEFLADAVDAVYRAFLLPGEVILSWIGAVSPSTASIMTLNHGRLIVPFILALIAWTVILIIGLMISRLCRSIAWQVAAIVRTLIHRFKSWVAGLKTQLIWKYRKLFPYREIAVAHVSPLEFDDLDMAVLRKVSERGPGFTSSAPELAEIFTLRPAQVQNRLEKLTKNNMLRTVIGSTDGFDNYRLTDAGLAFVAMLQRRKAAG